MPSGFYIGLIYVHFSLHKNTIHTKKPHST